jgi:prophage antirepressor-like protein
MSNDLTIFNNELFGSVRIMMIDEKWYFVANDIATALGYAKPRNAISSHCKHSQKILIDVTPQNGASHNKARKTQEMTIIPESDVYRLIIKSKLPEADQFEEWVMEDVLPQLRQCGVYITENATQESIDFQSLYGKNRIYNTFLNTNDLHAEYERFSQMAYEERKARHINNDVRIYGCKQARKAIEKRMNDSVQLLATDSTAIRHSKILEMRELIDQIQVDITKLSNKANGGFKANMTRKIKAQQQQLEFMETELIEARNQYEELEHLYEEHINIQEQGEDVELIEINYYGFSNNDMYDYIDGKVRRTQKYNNWINHFPTHTIDTLSEDVDFDKPMACELYFDHGQRYDVHNFIKPMLDMIARANGKDDKNIRKVSCVTNEFVNDHWRDGRIYLKLYNIELDAE